MKIFAAVLCLGFLAGCGIETEKIRTEINTAMLSARERATAWSAVAVVRNEDGTLTPRVPAVAFKDQAGVDRYVVSHAEGLSADAKALSDFLAASANKKLSKIAVFYVASFADTARMRVENFDAMRPKMKLDAAYADTHRAGLVRLADQAKALAEELAPKAKEPKAK